jgi:hypothetical protein
MLTMGAFIKQIKDQNITNPAKIALNTYSPNNCLDVK